MAVRTIAEVTVTDETDIDHLVTWYLRSTSPTKPSAPQDGSAPPSPWTSSEPGYDSSLGTTYLYTVTQTVWGDGSLTYGEVQLSSAYEAAKAAYNEASSVRTYATTEFQRTDAAIALRATKEEVEEVAGRIVGRNLFRGTKDAGEDNWSFYGHESVPESGVLRLTPTTAFAFAKYNVDYLDFTEYGSGTFTVSLDVRRLAGEYTDKRLRVILGFNRATRLGHVLSSTHDRFGSVYIAASEIGTDWTRVSATFDVPEDFNTGRVATLEAGSQLTVEFLLGESGNPVEIRRVKLERGDVATEWSEAPEDYTDEQVSIARAEIKVTTDGITTEVEKKTDKATIISTINQSAETVKIEASKVEITGDAVFSAINNDTGTTKISGGKIDATSITIGQSQVTNLTTDLAAKATPADITTAIGAIEIGGRNLLRYLVYDYADANNVVSASNVGKSMYCAVDGGETYTVSRRVIEGNRFWIDWSEQEPESGVALHSLSKDNNALEVTVDVPSAANWLFIYLSNQSDVINDGNIKVERGTKATDWTPAPEDVDASIMAVQDDLNATRTWYATCPTASGTAAKVATITPATTDFALAAGVTVAVKFDAANSVANPTLSVNGTDACAIKRYGTTAPSTSAATSWQDGSVATLTYDGTYWQLNNWLNNNDNYYDREAYKAALAASAAISSGRIAVLGTDGKLKLLSASAFDTTGPIVYVGTAYSAADATAGTARTNNYTFWGSAFNLTNTHAVAGAAAGKPVYVVGTLSGKTFTPNSTVLTCTIPTSVDSLVYMRLGIMSTTANAVLESQHPLYMYFNGAFQQCDPATADAAKTATNYITADTNGISIHMQGNSTTYQRQTASGTTFYVNNGSSQSVKRAEVGASGLTVYVGNTQNSETDVAHFGTTARVGAESGPHIVIDTDGMTVLDGEKATMALTSESGETTGRDPDDELIVTGTYTTTSLAMGPSADTYKELDVSYGLLETYQTEPNARGTFYSSQTMIRSTADNCSEVETAYIAVNTFKHKSDATQDNSNVQIMADRIDVGGDLNVYNGIITAQRKTGTMTLNTTNCTLNTDYNKAWHNGVVATVQLGMFTLNSALANGSTVVVGTVPSGYRPAGRIYANVACALAGVTGLLVAYIGSDGTITLVNRSGASLSTSVGIIITATYAI